MSHEATVPSNKQSATSLGTVVADQFNYLRYGESNGPTMSSKAIDAETNVRRLESNLRRDIVRARLKGVNIGAAERQQRLGEISLAKGESDMAASYFRKAEAALRTPAGPLASANAYAASQDPSAANMNPDNRAITAY
jgi:hypothetical protein